MSAQITPTPASSISKVRSLLGSWRRAPTETDLEAQTISGVHVPVELELAAPPAAQTPAPRAQSPAEEEGTNPIDDFFGVTRRAGTQDSRHDAVREPLQQDAPPPYVADPPAYTRKAEFPTLAMYLFKFGFLFPLFWIAGALILLSPPREPEEWASTKTEAERKELMEIMRRSEIKWAKRCLFASCLLALIVVVIVLTAILVMRS
ncbi:hypothetical protein CERSUDRAFT_92580 [Gelatoporia subvermispora B]|uniref:Transmembrane protein n=1 Tax=Ceriporiopsis subvermispora (strain B) TaxID=914234 RepID=M2PTN6_CERS8|nr:hypothetical protein CERSUDRAFT_92580 [Gelatoporia subvermispora B]